MITILCIKTRTKSIKSKFDYDVKRDYRILNGAETIHVCTEFADVASHNRFAYVSLPDADVVLDQHGTDQADFTGERRYMVLRYT